MQQFDLDDLNRDFLSADAKEAMLELILALAYLDGAIAIWVGAKFEVRSDKAAILLGRTDGKGKLRKLQKLYGLEGESGVAADIKKAGVNFDKQIAARNILAHAGCLGSLHSDPTRIVFAAYEALSLGQMAIQVVPLEHMNVSARWARQYAREVEQLLGALKHPTK